MSELTLFASTRIRRSSLVRAYTICMNSFGRANTILIYLDQKEQPCQTLYYLYLLGSEGAVLSELPLFAFTWIRMSSLVRAYTICIYLDQKEQSCQSLHHLHLLGSEEALLSELPLFVFCIRRSSLFRAYTICMSSLVRAYTFGIYLDQNEKSCKSLHSKHLLQSE